MKRLSILALASLVATVGCAQESTTSNEAPAKAFPPVQSNAPAAPKTISIQEMLVNGPSPLKLYSLAMITQHKFEGEIDESFLPGFKVCAEDSALPVRSVAAQLLGQYFVQGKENPNPEALALLVKLAHDESPDVRFNAVYYGLTPLKNKSDEVLRLLIDVATTHPEKSLYDQIAASLKQDRKRVIQMLDKKLKKGNNIAIYEIYEDLTGQKPANAEKYLEMPSSRPRLFIFTGKGTDPNAYKAELERAVMAAGVENPNITISGAGENYVLLLKTYITKDYGLIEKAFSNNPEYKISQEMWLTPELEIQINAMQNK